MQNGRIPFLSVSYTLDLLHRARLTYVCRADFWQWLFGFKVIWVQELFTSSVGRQRFRVAAMRQIAGAHVWHRVPFHSTGRARTHHCAARAPLTSICGACRTLRRPSVPASSRSSPRHAAAGADRTAKRYCLAFQTRTRPLAQSKATSGGKAELPTYESEADHRIVFARAGVQRCWRHSRTLDTPHKDQNKKGATAHASLGARPIAAVGTVVARRKKSRGKEVALSSKPDIRAVPPSSIRLSSRILFA